MNASPVGPLAAVAALITAVGCGGPTFEERVGALATPTGALASLNPALPRLVKEVEQQRGLPLQLAGPATDEAASNAAAALAAAYSPSLHLQLAPSVEALADPAAEPAARHDFLQRHELLLQKTADAADLPRCRFDVGHEYGFFGAMGYLDDATLAVRLLLVRGQHAGAKKDRVASLADLMRAMRVCHWLSEVRRVEARVLAVSLRASTLDVIASLFDEGTFHHYEAEQIYGLIREELNDWPSDGRMLVGERATVIHAYEAIRAGMLDRLITLDERRQLASGGRIENLHDADAATIDADEARYLRALQTLLNVAERPRYERLEAIAAALEMIDNAPTLFAATLFTQDLVPAINNAAEDRARVEEWAIALALAAELKAPPFRDSPVTGKPFEVEREAGRVFVFQDGVAPLSLPLMMR